MKTMSSESKTLLRTIVFLLLLIGNVPLIGRAQSHPDPHKPALDLFVYRRSHTANETVKVRLSAYNQKTVQFTAFRLNLPALIPTSRALEDFGKRIAAVDVSRLRAVKSWSFGLGVTYPDQWAEREVNAPHLPPGVYLIRAKGDRAEKRTWLSVSDIALLSKRSRQEILVFATSAHSGQPKPGLRLTMTDAQGRSENGVTDAQGIWRAPRQDSEKGKQANIWLYGEQAGHPAFLLSGAPAPPSPFTIYMFTDRPVYRPGHTIQFKGTVRQRVESDAPGGFTYRPYVNKELYVEVRDATDALVKREKLKTNAYGSFDGNFSLASEPVLGRWQLIAIIGELRSYANMEVQAYRKPEYSVGVSASASHFTGGNTVPVTIEGRYYFGQPVANAAVNYNIQFTPEPGNGPMEKPAEPPYSGQGVLDAQGRLNLEIKTQRLPYNRRITVSATVTDLSRRSQSATGSALITAGRFHISVSPEKAVYHAGERVNILVQAEDYDGKPIATKVRVRLIETKQDNQRRPYKETTTRDIFTDAGGKGTAQFTPSRPGYLELATEAFDQEDNKIVAGGYVWIAGEDIEGYDYPNLDLLPDRTTYRPGEVATVLLNTSLVTPRKSGRSKKKTLTKEQLERPTYATAWALVVLEGERLYSHQLLKLTGRSTTLRIPLEEKHFPSVRLSVVILQERQIYEQDVRLVVERDQPKLRVSVTADREKYAPGQEVVYTISTHDYLGRPVPAEVGIGVVDASIYAIQPDNTPNLNDFFYGGQEVRVQTDFSFAAQYSGGAAQTVPTHESARAPGQEGAAGIRVRRQFADTAIWRPYVVTGADGAATLRFTLPDNLTTWRATARGMTLNTAVGSGMKDVVSTMPLLIRLSLPRFYVEGDQAVVSAIVHNYTGDTRTVHAHIEAAGAALQGDADRNFTLAANGEERLDWRAKIGGASSSSAPTDPAKFLITADGGPGGRDATELTLPVLQDGLKQVDVKADSLAETSGEIHLDLNKIPSDATINVSLAPSLAAATFEALDYLTTYPYGCAEQTMSSFLPDVIVARALKRLNISRKPNPDLEKWVSLGLQKLYRYQHPDGGWNWWEFDQTDGDMTAYVLWGLVQAKDAGYLVDEQRILRGTEVLVRMLSKEREWNRRAEWVLTLAYARPQAVTATGKGATVSPLEGLFANRDKLDTLGLASLCLALAQTGGAHATEATLVARELESKATAQGTTVHWPAADGGYTWRGDDAGVTAHVLRALLSAAPKSALIPKAVRWLMGNRVGKAWQSTRSSAEAVFALAEYMERNSELQSDFSTDTLLDDMVLQKTAWTPAKAFDAPVLLTVTPDQWRNHKTLTIRKQGSGVLYASFQIAYTIPSSEAKAGSGGISVRRFYRITAEDPSHADTIASGQDVEVNVEVTAEANYRYAILEEPIPAGCEVGPPDEMLRPQGLFFENGGGYVRQEVRDNKVVFFFDDLPKGRATFTYRLHAETPGVYRILPSLVALVYFPEVRGNSAPVQARIGER